MLLGRRGERLCIRRSLAPPGEVIQATWAFAACGVSGDRELLVIAVLGSQHRRCNGVLGREWSCAYMGELIPSMDFPWEHDHATCKLQYQAAASRLTGQQARAWAHTPRSARVGGPPSRGSPSRRRAGAAPRRGSRPCSARRRRARRGTAPVGWRRRCSAGCASSRTARCARIATEVPICRRSAMRLRGEHTDGAST